MSVQEAVLTIEAIDDNMDEVTAFIDEFLSQGPCSAAARVQLTVAVEEIFVNIAHYAYGEKVGNLVIRGNVSRESPWTVVMVFEDDGMAFNPLEVDPPNLTPAVRRRQVGGLGIFLVRSMTDEIGYERREGKNILTIKKTMELERNK